MTFKSKRVALAVAQALGIGSAVAMIGTPANAAERIEVTGSIIKRVEQEGALPVITLDRKYIEDTGFTTATELIQSLPSMQNFVPTSSSVNGSGAGVATAALHALPSKYTLVLVNGQRTAGLGLGNTQGGGNSVNIQSIPLAAVERVEILTDGASAVYGADAIAGVVNFILKKTETEGIVFGQYTKPQKDGGAAWTAGVSKGWGDLDKDKWNLTVTFSHDSQDEIRASQRSVSQRGAFFPFTQNGVNYIFNAATSNTEPANIQSFNAYPTGGNPASAKPYTFNPYYETNKNCGGLARSVLLDPTGTGALGATGESCRFNYAAFVQDLPAVDRNSLVANATWRINDDMTAYATYAWSNNNLYAQYAPPAQPFGINPTTRNPTLYNRYVVTFLAANNLTIVPPSNPSAPWATVGYRGVSLGGRADNYDTSWNHFAAGLDGRWSGWDYGLRFNTAETKFTDTFAGGYTDSAGLNAAIAAGLYDPVAGTGANSVTPFILKQLYQKINSNLSDLHLTAQHDMWQMAGGKSIIAFGADYIWAKYKQNYGPYGLVGSGYDPVQNDPATGLPYTATAVGGPGGQVPVNASRNNWGIYSEALFPVLKNLEFTGSLRYDYYDKVNSKFVFSTTPDANGNYPQIANADLGNTFNDLTYKISARWTPIETVLLRGSYGTGFKAPTFSDIAGPLVFNGSTANSYTCPFPGTSGCIAGSAQYDLLAGPNGLSGAQGLKPEKSKQWVVGARWDPIKQVSIGADFWNVKITDQILSQGIAEQVAFANPQQYAALFTNPYVDPVGGFNTIALAQIPFNGGDAKYQGIDWDANWRSDTPIGFFTAALSGTHIFKAQYTFGPGQPFESSLGQYGPDQQVVFKNTMQLIMNLTTGAWNNNITGHYKSGYEDQSYLGGSPADVFFANPDGSIGKLATSFDRLHVPSYTTWDYQLSYSVGKGDKYNVWTLPIKLYFGVQNVFDRKPPFSLQTGGGGNQVGYDGRYADPTGRAYYVRAEVRF